MVEFSVGESETLKESAPKEPRAACSSSITFVMHHVVFAFLVIEKVQL